MYTAGMAIMNISTMASKSIPEGSPMRRIVEVIFLMKIIVFKIYVLAGNIVQGSLTLHIHVGCRNLADQAA